MAIVSALILELQSRLQAAADPRTKDWWERYLKGAIEFRGVPMAGIRAAVHEWHDAERIDDLYTPTGQRRLALKLVELPQAEDKLAGILYLQEIVLPAGWFDCGKHLKDVAGLFDRGHIADWNTCDWLCVRVLGPLAQQRGEACARAIAGWSDAADLWRARAAGVAFVNLAPAGEENFCGFTAMLLDVCERNVARTERFAQTGVGWVLRELSRAEPDRVADFVRRHIVSLSREAIRSSVRKLPESTAADLLDLHAG